MNGGDGDGREGWRRRTAAVWRRESKHPCLSGGGGERGFTEHRTRNHTNRKWPLREKIGA